MTAVLLLALPAAAGEAPIRASKPAPGFWLKTYPLPDYGAFWSLRLDVADVAKARDKALSIIRKGGGTFPQPVESFPSSKDPGYQQLSFKIDRARAQKAFDALARLGRTITSTQKDSLPTEHGPELEIKLGKLKAEREIGRETLSRLPSTAALADELIEHLEQARSAEERARGWVLVNLVLEAAPKK